MKRTVVVHGVKVGVRNGDYSIPPDVTFSAFVMDRPNEKLDENSSGCFYDQHYGIIYVECGTFPTQWNEMDVVHIDVLSDGVSGQADAILTGNSFDWCLPNPIMFGGICEPGQGVGISYAGEQCNINVCPMYLGSHEINPDITFKPETGAVIVRAAVLANNNTALMGFCPLAYILFFIGNREQTIHIKLSYEGWFSVGPFTLYYYDGMIIKYPDNIVITDTDVSFTITDPGAGVCFYLQFPDLLTPQHPPIK